MNTARFLASSAFYFAACATGLSQGPVAPTGTPGPTMKTLDQVQPRTPISSIPFTITQAGSYYLTKNVTVSGANEGILIQADNVTIDLSGFTLDGANVGRNGVTTNGTNYRGLQIRNGNSQNWTIRGFDLQSSFSTVLENLQATNNPIGIFVSSGMVTRCAANFNTGTGITANFSTIRDCTAEANPVGINVYSSTMKDCRVGDSSDTGILADRSVVENCQLDGDHYGIVVNGQSNVHHNNLLFCGSDGIRLIGGASIAADNNISDSGISVAASGIWCPSTIIASCTTT